MKFLKGFWIYDKPAVIGILAIIIVAAIAVIAVNWGQ